MRIITVSASLSRKREVWFTTGCYSHVTVSIIDCEFFCSSEDELIYGALTGPSSDLELIRYFDRRTVLRCVEIGYAYVHIDGRNGIDWGLALVQGMFCRIIDCGRRFALLLISRLFFL